MAARPPEFDFEKHAASIFLTEEIRRLDKSQLGDSKPALQQKKQPTAMNTHCHPKVQGVWCVVRGACLTMSGLSAHSSQFTAYD
jgi:hypothetical protein